jgi:undecaprenyl-diphosphatase
MWSTTRACCSPRGTEANFCCELWIIWLEGLRATVLGVNNVAKKSALPIETATFLKLFISAVCAWVLVRLGGTIRKDGTHELDSSILRMLRRSDDPATPLGPKWLADAARDVTALGSGANLSLATAIVIGTLCLNRRFRAAGFLLASIGSGMVLSRLLKDFFERERPSVVPRLTDFDSGSFPSGHSMLSALVYLTLGGIVSRQTRRLAAKVYFLSVALVLSLLVGISRVYLGVHFPSDILAGWAAGSLWSSACTQAARWLQRKGSVEPPAEPSIT